ncbi:MAG: tRNA (guanosine(46)-N7)-methyltransferase TrmB [Patescibacteria group bacterium]|jgi:tRNA (guanine-N7-)-methyltransferase
MPKNKLKKFAEIKTFSNVIRPAKPQNIDWKKHFGNDNPITLELACGKGDYTLGLARIYPNRNFIGIDIKGARLWKGAKTALEEKLANVAFLRARIENLEKYFIPENVETRLIASLLKKSQPIIPEIWITFPDPFPRKRDAKRRLTSPRFLEIYKKILQPGGIIHLKTDNLSFFNYSVETSEAENWQIKKIINNIYSLKTLPFNLQIKTFYEEQHLKNNKQIHYLKIKKEARL